MPLSNPFFHRGPVRDRAFFFGREHEMGQMLSLLGNGQSVSLVGQRRIGKTSLLFQITNPEVFAPCGLKPDEHLFVYVDCGGLGGLDQPGLYRVLLEETGEALADKGQSRGQLEALDDGRPMTYRAFDLIRRRAEGYDYLSSAFHASVESQPVAGLLQAGPVAIDQVQRQAFLHSQPLSLTSTQYVLLVHLVERAGGMITTEELKQAV